VTVENNIKQMKGKSNVLGLDIGGTKISSGLHEDGIIYERKEISTPYNSPKEKILEAISDHISSYLSFDLQAIGIGIPGLVDPKKGIVYNLANIPSFQKVGLKDYLEEKFNMPVFINNDASCFTLGEYKYGRAKIHQHMVGITLGTGIGTGVITNTKLYTGYLCGAGEWGGASYMDKTFEDYCGSKFFNSSGESAKTLGERASEKDKEALLIFEQYGIHLGSLIKQILFTYAPEAIVIGGSIRKAFPYFEENMLKTVKSFPYRAISDHLKIYVSSLEDSAILGAIALSDENDSIMANAPFDHSKVLG
jgi:glucokinase